METLINKKDPEIIKSKEEQILDLQNKYLDIRNNPEKYKDVSIKEEMQKIYDKAIEIYNTQENIKSKEEEILEVENKILYIRNNSEKFISDKKAFFDKQIVINSSPLLKEPINTKNTTFYYLYLNLRNEIEINPQKFIDEELENLNKAKENIEKINDMENLGYI